MALPKVLAFVDVETTGTSYNNDKIIDIGIIRTENGKIVETFESLIDPQTYLPEQIVSLTGILPKDLEKAPTFYSIKDKVENLLEKAVFVAHNADFDYRFVKNELKRCGVKLNSKRLCTVKLSRLLYPKFKRHNLDSLILRHKLKNLARHRGFGDANLVYQFYNKILKFKLEEAKLIISKLLVSNSSFIPGKEGLIKNLKSFPGVYIFYDNKNVPLYIGKSIDVKKRIQSHFSVSASPTDFKLSSQTSYIETRKTCGELEALILESNLIKKFSPLYNRLLRNKKQIVIAELEDSSQNFLKVNLKTVDEIAQDSLKNIIGTFKSVKQAKIYLTQKALNFSLCDKLLGLQKTNSSCFGFTLGRCKGACLGRENYLKYNLRVTGAFFKDKFKPWPFSGPIGYLEKNSEEETLHLIDKWCYLGKVSKNSSEIPTGKNNTIDVDLYKILVRFLLSPKNFHKIIPYEKIKNNLQFEYSPTS